MFKKTLTVAMAAGALLSAPAMADTDETRQDRVRAKAEAKLAEKLEGRVAGEPVRCIPNYRNQRTTIYDETAIVWEVGSKLYVNRPESGLEALDDNDIMVTDTVLNQLCSVDTIRMVDQTGFMRGVVFLGDFVPYERVEDDD
ncbi:hypothetical protein [Croceicoccus sp. YJ47]|uniref:hypothetical protein n=1 Tax=Croceicoccus sp. YJ47 TaxID=2798724 RepID=UPI001923E8D3|nr:hypothetical protein [Croceicoccus sp. YJ47]QQN73087.1 hypothetical protein JD971_09340 [Croceicoccus sp. YJ47]